MDDGVAQARGSLWSSVATLFATSGTLVCCALPALLVALGAGAALSSLVSVFPQVVWLSEHKEALFGLAGAALLLSGWIQWRNRNAPCPVDPALRSACLRTRGASRKVYFVSLGFYAIGGWFAFIQPQLA
ncbi:MAG TPA: hypothetical protein VIL30_12640 [Ramlibacter sp.]|jgi:hypothetical protein